VNSLIASGKRNFALDLSPLDYIYSDTINALMALNRITLDVSGRLSLLGPKPEVLQILKRAGIHNILRIFDNETELIRTSEDIILQTSSFHLGELKNLAQQEPQSEFDQLRSEIGSAFGGAPSDMQEESLPPPPKTKNISSFMPSQPPAVGPVVSSIEQEFDDAFSQFESEDNSMDYNAVAPNQYNNPQATNFIPPPPPTRTVYNPAAAQFQNRQYMPQPPVSPVPPPRPAVPQTPAFESPQMPSAPQPTDFSGVRNDRLQPPPTSTRVAQPVEDEFEEEIKGKGRASKPKVQDDSFDESDDEFFEGAKKKSPLPMLVIIVILLALGGVGVYFAYNMLSSKPAVQTPVTTTPQPQPPAPPPALTDTTSKVSGSEAKEEEKEATEEKLAENKSESRVSETARVSQPKPKPRSSAPAPKRSSAPVSKPAVSENKVVITSTPSGAKVTINGDYLGITPYTWDTPIYGPLSVVVSKEGYEDDSKVFEFTGGSIRENFSLRKAAIAPPPPPVTYSEPEPEPEPAPVPEPEPMAPKYTPPTPPAPEPVVTKVAPVPVSSSITGGEASIFIASIPPVADVYLDGKLVGKTNVSEIKLPAGTHNLKFVKGVKEITKAITVQPGKNPSQMVRLQ